MAANNEWLFSLLMAVGRMFPMFLVWFIGLIIALVRWRRHPGVSALVVAAVAVAGVTSIATQVVYTVLPRYWDLKHFANVAGIIGIASAFVYACAWGCMLAAVFVGRSSTPDQAGFGGVTKTSADKTS
jgi:hypothetical protein